MREPTEDEKRRFTAAIVDIAIVQAAESSGLRKWLRTVGDLLHRLGKSKCR
jgi:hypothetical protein